MQENFDIVNLIKEAKKLGVTEFSVSFKFGHQNDSTSVGYDEAVVGIPKEPEHKPQIPMEMLQGDL